MKAKIIFYCNKRGLPWEKMDELELTEEQVKRIEQDPKYNTIKHILQVPENVSGFSVHIPDKSNHNIQYQYLIGLLNEKTFRMTIISEDN